MSSARHRKCEYLTAAEIAAIFAPLGTLPGDFTFMGVAEMSKSLNRAELLGNLGADPEIRTVGKDSRVATISVATTATWRDAKGDKQERTEWHRVILWDGLADVAEDYLHKGDRVYIDGEIQYRTYDDKEGITRYSTEIRASNLIMLSPAPATSENSRKTGADRGAARRTRKARGDNA